jgi:hypothetical protein
MLTHRIETRRENPAGSSGGSLPSLLLYPAEFERRMPRGRMTLCCRVLDAAMHPALVSLCAQVS